MPYWLLLTIFSLLLVPGVIGTLFPVIPGIPYMFAITVVFAFIDNFKHMSVFELVIFAFITLFSIAIDYFSGLLGAKYGGASRFAMALGFLGMIIGLVSFPPFGGLVGLFVGVLAGEIIKFKDQKKALKAASSSFFSSLMGSLLNLIISLVYLLLFIIFSL